MEGSKAQSSESSGTNIGSAQLGSIYRSQAHELALERLNFAVASRVPMTVFMGRVGTGRTRLVCELIETNTSAFVVRMLNPLDRLSGEVFSDVLAAFNPKRTNSENVAQNRADLMSLLETLHAAQRFPVLVVDDADDLSNVYLGALCELCDQAVNSRPLLKLVFVGRPGMADILSGVRPDLVGPAFTLECMDEKDTGGYVRSRFAELGIGNRKLDKSAIREFFVLSNGIPAKLNAICDRLKKEISQDVRSEIDKVQIRQAASHIRADDPGGQIELGQGAAAHSAVPTDAEVVARADHVAEVLRTAAEAEQKQSSRPQPAKRGIARKAGAALGACALVGAGVIAFLYGTDRFSIGQSGLPNEDTISGSPGEDVFVGESAAVSNRASRQTAAVAEARVARIAAALAESEPSATGQYLAALELAETAADAAVVGYARAALSGHSRSAYYLGQIYETGEGVPVDLALARVWYTRAKPGIDGAAARLEDMQPSTEGGAVSEPTPLYSNKMPDGSLELVWTSGEGADPSAYRIELSSTLSNTVLYTAELTTSAIRLKPPQAARIWRVIALDQNGGEAASPWMEIRLR